MTRIDASRIADQILEAWWAARDRGVLRDRIAQDGALADLITDALLRAAAAASS